MSIRQLLLLLLVFQTPSLHAEMDVNTKAEIYVNRNAGTTPTIKSAHVTLRMLKTYEDLKVNAPHIVANPTTLKSYMDFEMNSAIAEYENRTWMKTIGRYAGTSVALGLGMTWAAPASGVVGQITDNVTKPEEDPVKFLMNPAVGLAARSYAFKAAVDPNHPAHEAFRNALVLTEGMDPLAFTDKNPSVTDFEMKKNMALTLVKNRPGLRENIKKAKSEQELGTAIHAQAQKEVAELSKRVNDLSHYLFENSYDAETSAALSGLVKQDGLTLKEKRDLITDGFGTLRSLGLLMGQKDFANKMYYTGKVGESVFDLWHTKKDDFKKNPFTSFNACLTAVNFAIALFSGGEESELAAVMRELQALKRMIVELHEAMLEQFSRLHLRLDADFLATFDSLGRLEGGEKVQVELLKNLQASMDDLRGQVADGHRANILMSANQTLGRCLNVQRKSNKPFEIGEDDFQNCRNWLAFAATGDYGPLNLKKVSESQAPSGVVNYLNKLAMQTNRKDFPQELNFHPTDWSWSVTKLLQLSRLHPEFEEDLIDDPATQSPTLDQIIKAGDDYLDFVGKVALENGKARADILTTLLEDYKKQILKTLDKVESVVKETGSTSTRAGLTFKHYGYEDDGNSSRQFYDQNPQDDQFFGNTRLPICNLQITEDRKHHFPRIQAQVTFLPPINDPEDRRQHLQYALNQADKDKLTQFPQEGLPLSPAFARFIPDSLLFALRDSYRNDKSKSFKLGGCFMEWEIARAFVGPADNTLDMNISMRLWVDYIKRGDHERIWLKDLKGRVSVTNKGNGGHYIWRDMNKSQPLVQWEGGKAHDDHGYLKPVKDDPSWVYPSQLLDPQAFAEFEEYYKGVLNQRNEGASETVHSGGMPGFDQRSTLTKAALLYILGLYSKDNQSVMQLQQWLLDPTHLANAKSWASVYFHNNYDRASLEKHLLEQLKVASDLIKGLSASNLTVVKPYEIEMRLLQLKELRKKIVKQ